MAKRKKKKSKEVKPPKKRSLQTVLNERIRFSGFFFPRKENKEFYNIPKHIIKYYESIFDIGDLFDEDDIEIIYSVNGELQGYYGIDKYYTNSVVAFVFYDLGPEYKDNIIFKLGMISTCLGIELPYNVTLRCVFMPKYVFCDNDIPNELLEKYDDYTSDACFFSKVPVHNTDMLYKGKLVRYFDRRAILGYDRDDCPHDVIYDLRKYANCLNDPSVISSLSPITGLIKNAHFAMDRLPTDDGKLGRFSSDIINSSMTYIGFNKIYFILPKISDKELTNFISTVFEGLNDPGYHGILLDTFCDRFGFFVEEHTVNKSKALETPLQLTFVENEFKHISTRYVEISPKDVYYRYYQKTS